MFFSSKVATGLILLFVGFKDVTSYTCGFKGKPKGRSAAGEVARPWPYNHVFYKFDPHMPNDFKSAFKNAAKLIEDKTCVRFKQHTRWFTSTNYVYVRRVGKRFKLCGQRYRSGGGVNHLGVGRSTMVLHTESMCSVANDPDFIGLIVHEILHVLGFEHTQKRPDRDDHVTVHTNNIEDNWSARYQFRKCHNCKELNTPYDCSSIMHYKPWAFSIYGRGSCNKKNTSGCTITAKSASCKNQLFGSHTKLTAADIQLIKNFYQCPQ